MSKAIYAFSGDPITFGHIDIIERASKIFTHIIAAIGSNPAKQYLFDTNERLAMAQQALRHLPNVTVTSFKGMLADYVYENDVRVVIRGLRNSEDFNFELMLHQLSETQVQGIETFLMPCSKHLVHVSSSAAKALQLEQGFVHQLVPLNVKQCLEDRISAQYIIGVTGPVASGKSTLCAKLKEIALQQGNKAHVIDVDKLAHEIIGHSTEAIYLRFRQQLIDTFGNAIMFNGEIDISLLGKYIFEDAARVKLFNALIYEPLLLRLRREMYGKRGLILLESAMLTETASLFICNNNLLLTQCTPQQQAQRLLQRGYHSSKTNAISAVQYSFEGKLKAIQQSIAHSGYGTLTIVTDIDAQLLDIYATLAPKQPAMANW